MGLEALAITDHDGFYGVVRFAEAARAVGLPTVFGAELTVSYEGRLCSAKWRHSSVGVAPRSADSREQPKRSGGRSGHSIRITMRPIRTVITC